ncbi:MAG: hypothetical protein Harvfovirus57_3 [Harvfovirus sp.]|uniref:Uncharacterized protein n=1 Tax=Harvfovirus sp. TaxID=2487768 RepID=A0A3G5A5E9_9VIRU|nr:MAG: hypothetical protein Harvfovirus57_3 [Harvfovirus sp.]
MSPIIISYALFLVSTFFGTRATNYFLGTESLTKLYNPFLIINIDTLIFIGISFVVDKIILRNHGGIPRWPVLILSYVLMINLDLLLSKYLIGEWVSFAPIVYLFSASLMCIGLYLISYLVSFSMKLVWRQYKVDLDAPQRVMDISMIPTE